MKHKTRPWALLMVEDNPHDILAAKRVWHQFGFNNHLSIVSDGEECLDYLFHQRSYADPVLAPRPDVVLLDLKLPKLDGHQVLTRIREEQRFRYLPVIILTDSTLEIDRQKGYEQGCNAYLKKPVGFAEFAELLTSLRTFWSAVEPYSQALPAEEI